MLAPRGWPFLTVAAAFAAYAFVPSGLSAHLLAIFGRAGLDAATVVTAGALFGPAQVFARICELVFARGVHPLMVARFAVATLLAGLALVALAGWSVTVALAFAVMFGIANGLITIARGTAAARAVRRCRLWRLIGRIAGPAMVLQAIAPLVLALVAERVSDPAVLMVVAMMALVAFRLPHTGAPAVA